MVLGPHGKESWEIKWEGKLTDSNSMREIIDMRHAVRIFRAYMFIEEEEKKEYAKFPDPYAAS